MFVLLAILFLHSADSGHRAAAEDTVRNHYLTHGAWQHSIFSPEYGREIDSALALSPADAYLWQQRSMPYFKQMKYEVGMRYLDSAVRLDADHWLDYRAFIKCIFQKSYRASLEDFDEAKRLHPHATVMDHEYDFYRGLCWLQLDHTDSAAACFQRCIAHDSASSTGWVHYLHTFYLGVTQYIEEQYTPAKETFDRTLGIYPHFSDAKYYAAACRRKLSDDAGARQLLLEARDDLAQGATINEDNAIYERYPYQVRASWIEGALEAIASEGASQ